MLSLRFRGSIGLQRASLVHSIQTNQAAADLLLLSRRLPGGARFYSVGNISQCGPFGRSLSGGPLHGRLLSSPRLFWSSNQKGQKLRPLVHLGQKHSINLRHFHSSVALFTADEGDGKDEGDDDEYSEDEELDVEDGSDDDEEDEASEEESDEDDEEAELAKQELPMQNMMMVSKVKTPEQVLVVPVIKTSIMPGTMGRAGIRDPEFLKELQELRQNNPSPYIGLFIVKDAEEARKKGIQITSIDQVHDKGVLGILTNVVPIRPSHSQKEGLAGFILFLSVHKRIKIDNLVPEQKRLTAKVTELIDKPYDPTDQQVKSYQAEIEAIVHRIGARPDVFARDNAAQLLLNFWTFHNPLNASESADFVAGIMTHLALDDAAMNFQQDVIEELDVVERLRKTLALTKRELNLSELSSKIKDDINAKMEERHKQMLLRDELKAIRTELGLEQPQTEALIGKFKERMKDKHIPEHAHKVITEEMDKFKTMASSSTEYNVVRTYLDWLTMLPWGVNTKDNLDMYHAEHILEDEHYGLKDVKDRILEFIAVGKLKGEVSGKIICLVGPPGVGKTSIGKSVSNALGREFFRFSVGGMTDEAEIKGHRRTYVGAMPGKLLQALKRTKTSNPLILIDEVDKIGVSGFKGDPSSALLEVLDPSQNTKFLDHYLDVSYDLSKVLFIATANVLHTIPRPLLDRMEVIRLSGYVEEEKINIAQRYLIPRAVSEAGLSGVKIDFKPDALHQLIRQYAREAGVRNLQQQIDKIMRKVAYNIVKEREQQIDGKAQLNNKVNETEEGKKAELAQTDQPVAQVDKVIEISEASLKDYLGKPSYTSDRYYDVTPPGVIMGLAWTSMGGSTPYIETVVDKHQLVKRQKEIQKRKLEKEKAKTDAKGIPDDRIIGGGGKLITTGQMGEVMQESSNIAYTYAKIFWDQLRSEKAAAGVNANSNATKQRRAATSEEKEEEFDSEFFHDVLLHMHLPEGATPKDGPSAGIGMVSSLLSLALNKPVRQNLAMTGEITVTGKVLPVGGIKEKVIAARRAGVKALIFPSENKKEWNELDRFLKEGLEVHFADYYRDVFNVAFSEGKTKRQRASKRRSSTSKANADSS